MKGKLKIHPAAKARDAWMKTNGFLSSSDPVTLKAPSDQRQFLENRLTLAFMAGWEAAERQKT